jgi:hypothetical protein
MMMFEVQERIDGAHPIHISYPLLPGDLLFRAEDGTWTKECPGLAVTGFVLTDEQVSNLNPREIKRNGLNYYG